MAHAKRIRCTAKPNENGQDIDSARKKEFSTVMVEHCEINRAGEAKLQLPGIGTPDRGSSVSASLYSGCHNSESLPCHNKGGNWLYLFI